MNLTFTHIDTACALLEISGMRILTDPVFDGPGKRYHHGWGAFSRKTLGPALQPKELGKIDLVLLSHHQHKDNLDNAGRAFLETVPTVISTPAAAKALPGTIGLRPWQFHRVPLASGGALRITATPCQHGPKILTPMIGQVTGFIIQREGLEHEAIYISGDTVFFEGVRQVARRFTIETAILHLGGVKFPFPSLGAKYTMDAKQAIKAIECLKPQRVIPIHFEGWSHFKESTAKFRKNIQQHTVPTRLIIPERGKKIELP